MTPSEELTKQSKQALQPAKAPQAAEQFDKAAQTICAAGALRVVLVWKQHPRLSMLAAPWKPDQSCAKEAHLWKRDLKVT